MARHERQLRLGEFAIDHMQVGAAHAARRNLDQDFAWSRARRRVFARDERLTGPLEHHRAHREAPARQKLVSDAGLLEDLGQIRAFAPDDLVELLRSVSHRENELRFQFRDGLGALERVRHVLVDLVHERARHT